MADRRVMAALVAVMASTIVFRQAVEDIRSMTIDESGLQYDRPIGSASLSEWFGQMAADRVGADTMLIPATVQDICSHVAEAIGLAPRGPRGSALPPDVKAAVEWVASNRPNVPLLRQQRCERLQAIEVSLAQWSARLWKKAAPHVRNMLAYAPKLAFVHALVVALYWPHTELVIDMAVGAQPLGAIPDTGVWRHMPTTQPCPSFEQLIRDDPDWNARLYQSIRAEGLKPENLDMAGAAWERTMEEVEAGWATPVAAGWAELNSRYPEGVRLMRRFGVRQGDRGCRCCDSGTASGHNPCTSHEERLCNPRADFPLEAAADFAQRLGIDGSWTMHVATNDVVAAFRRVACADPRVTIVAQWDPRPAQEGGQRVALFYVQGFNFGIKSAVMAYNAVAELQTRAAVRLLPVVACHYFDDVCCAEPDYACHSAQMAVQMFFRLTGIHLDAVQKRNGDWLPAKRQTPAMLQKFLGVVTDFTRFARTGNVQVFVPQARIDKVRQMISAAIARAELPSGDAASLCGKLQFCLSWGVGRFGRAALGALYRQAHRPNNPRINLALEMSLNFFDTALRSLRVRNICVAAVSRLPPILLWSDATGTNEGESALQIAFVARFPGGIPAPSDPPGLTPIHPRWVHSAMVVPPHVLNELEARKQQIGQLELLAAIVGYYSMTPFLTERDVIHFIDNTAAVAGIAKGFSAKPDSARIIHAYHALNVKIGSRVYFEWVKSEANIADLPSRGEFGLLNEFGSRQVPIVVPPISDWLSPEEAMRNAAAPPKRGGNRH